jgi:hypothetical protein
VVIKVKKCRHSVPKDKIDYCISNKEGVCDFDGAICHVEDKLMPRKVNIKAILKESYEESLKECHGNVSEGNAIHKFYMLIIEKLEENK